MARDYEPPICPMNRSNRALYQTERILRDVKKGRKIPGGLGIIWNANVGAGGQVLRHLPISWIILACTIWDEYGRMSTW